MLRHFSRDVFQIFNLGNIFENFGQIVPKKWFLGKKITFFDFYGQHFQKYCLFQKFEKKKFLELCLNMLFKQFLHF